MAVDRRPRPAGTTGRRAMAAARRRCGDRRSRSALGLTLVEPGDRDPLRAASDGLGELILDALARGVDTLVVCIGGTSTVDGGVGLRRVLGDRLRDVRVRAACDVRNPLLGERGAARVFAAQKGADEAGVDELERRLTAMPELAPFRDVRGAGAGGGLRSCVRCARGRARRGRRARPRPDRLRRARGTRRARDHR